MNTSTRAQQQQEDPPSRWNTKWYRFRLKLYRLTARLLGMPHPHDVTQALKNEYWRGFRNATKHYLGHCPEHPEEPTLATGYGFRKCCLCWDESYFKRFDVGPVTDPRQITHPSLTLRALHHPDVGPQTQRHRATWPTKPPQQRREG